jgi:cellulose synthase/poly-beta-1,6-N-acetylglucosamine synthase-like glycosyltransferase/peptidoglycan/xylan/chitin deacetylase (PgdA/CDA1 family)
LFVVCFGVVIVLIAVQGYAQHAIGPEAAPQPVSLTSAAPLAGEQSILHAERHSLQSRSPAPGRRLALTFDDGPDPRYTPQIADYLRSQHVPGAFFVVGTLAARHPGIIRQLDRDGFQLANHTLTHTALSNGPEWHRHLQVDLTQAVLVGLTGRYQRMLRPPYSSSADSVTRSDERNLARIAQHRYVLVLSDHDSNDWRHKDVDRIVADATPRRGEGGTVLFHDGGGNRELTLAALKIYVPRMRAAGYRFVSVPELAGIDADVLAPKASALDFARGWLFSAALWLAFAMAGGMQALVLLVGVLVALRALVVLPLANHHRRGRKVVATDDLHRPKVAVVVPAYNERVGIERSIRSFAGSDYGDLEIVVVNDGSTDDTARVVDRLAEQLPTVRVISKSNGGKPSALNTGWQATDAPVIVMVDADTLFERDTILRLVQPLRDPNVGAVSGNTKVGNRSGLLGRWQHIEYVMGFNLDRRMYEVLQCTPTVPGAVGAFPRSVLEKIGGVPSDTLAEDTDLTLTIGRCGHRVMYADDARAWTEAPSTWLALWRQRYRWSYGTMQAVWKHKGAMVSRDARERRIGRRALPYITFFQILLPLTAPLIDIFAVYGLIFTAGSSDMLLISWLAFNVFQLLVAFYSFKLDGESPKPLLVLPLQQFVYRQVMYFVIIESTISALVGLRAHWQTVERTGDAQVLAKAEAGIVT